MSFRKEEKFPCSAYDQKLIFNELIEKGMKPLYEGRTISSTYFDTKDSNCYKDSQEGSLPRKKIRIRHYPGSQNIKYNEEIKISSIEGRFKISNPLTFNQSSDLIKFGINDKIYGVCYPVLEVSYKRTYFKYDKVRITFDTDIRYVNCVNKFSLQDPETVIEIKAEDKYSRQYLEDLITIPRRRFSKYSRGFEKVVMRS
jgi:hypothetical protein